MDRGMEGCMANWMGGWMAITKCLPLAALLERHFLTDLKQLKGIYPNWQQALCTPLQSGVHPVN